MRYDELVPLLLQQFPVLVSPYEKLLNRHKAINEVPGPHVVYGDIFCDYLIGVAQGSKSDLAQLRHLAAWIEKLASDKDQEVRNVIEVSVLERLADEEVNEIIPLLGSNSKKLARNLCKRLHLNPKSWGQFCD